MGTPITPYGGNDAKKAQVARMFDNIAHRYDFLNHFFSLGIDKLWRRKAVRMLLSQDPKEVLDVATGTADFAIEAAKKAPHLKVVGVDISAGMLDIGRTKVTKAKQDGRVELVLGDGEQLPFEDGRFDAFTVAFGVRNFENLPAGLKEMNRTMRSGGRGYILEFSKPRMFPMKQLFWLYFRYIMPTLGKWFSKDASAYTYLPESVKAFPEGEDMRRILE
ncbi:MAG: bifunctional demethylmenaquinone methyltransferase/2-methoxy-6-polyprenyl-1,4-benzoquinol methylase UbiE, partial [Flavobacteriales bacterium]|nr:bifunctional demethylmenaquinone methyltransferase/2-methoxy-6-polyprenyl-1,4-benzoquinol methylase UbiE [Flavobacteriales bacterium]